MKRSLIIFGLFFTVVFLSAQIMHPEFKIQTAGAITDFGVSGTSVLLSTDAGTIETYDLQSGKRTDFVELPKMKDFMGDDVPTKVFSIDKIGNKIVVVIQGAHGFRNVFTFQGGTSEQIISATADKLMIKKVRWLNENKILLGLMSNELMVYNLEHKQYICTLSISPYTFSDFSLTDDKQKVFTSDESGIVHQVDIKSCSLNQDFVGVNVDNIYQLVYKSDIVITAGQDRRVGVYNITTNDHYYLQKDFLVYSVGLSPDGSIGAYSATEENEISIFRTKSRQEICLLKGHESVVTKIELVDNQMVISAGDDHYLMIWKIQ